MQKNDGSRLSPRLVAKFLKPAALLIVDDAPLVTRGLTRVADRAGLGCELLTAHDLESMRGVVFPGATKARRPPLRGILLDWFLDARRRVTALDALGWLDHVYPRTPVVLMTASDVPSVAEACDARGVTFEAADPEEAPTGELGAIRVGARPVRLVSLHSLDRVGLARLDARFFAPWNTRHLDIREWLLRMAGANVAGVEEYMMRTLDAFFESVTLPELHRARGVVEETIGQHMTEIRQIWGIRHPSELKQLWERASLGRGAERPRSQGGESPDPDGTGTSGTRRISVRRSP